MFLSLRLLSSFFLVLALSGEVCAHDYGAPSFRFVVTGKLMGVSDGSRPFFDSPLFRLKSTSKSNEKFVISSANKLAFRFRDTVYLPLEVLSKRDLTSESKLVSQGIVRGHEGAQLVYFAAKKNGALPFDIESDEFNRELGAVPTYIKWELRELSNRKILAFKPGKESQLDWPSKGDQIDEILSVRGRFGAENDTEFLFFPRQIAPTDRIFGVVDDILKRSSDAQYLDLGDALLGSDRENIEIATGLRGAILKRNPVVMGAGWQDFRAFWQDASLMKNAPYVAALSGNQLFKSFRTIKSVSGQPLILAALPSGSELLEMVLPVGTSVKTLKETTDQLMLEAKKTPTAFVIGMSLDDVAAAKAVHSPVFDLVLSTVSEKVAVLPSHEEIDVAKNRRNGLKSLAPVIGISSTDVTQVEGYTDSSGLLERIVVHRQAVVDAGEVASDLKELVTKHEKKNSVLEWGLPSRSSVALRGTAYTESEYGAVLGGLLKQVQSDTELAIIDKHDIVTPIESEIPRKLADSLLDHRGRAVWLTLRGKYLKRIFKAIKSKQFGVEVCVVGGTIKGPTVSMREVSDVETYKVVVSERVFYAIDRFMSRENLFATRSLPSSSLQTALLEGGKDTLKILSEIRKRDQRATPDIGESRTLFASSIPIADLVGPSLDEGLTHQKVTSLISYSEGRTRPSFILDISDLDLGLKLNAVSSTLLDWQKEASDADNPGFTDSRFWGPNFSQKLFYAKVNLNYFGTVVESRIGASIKFFQPNTEGENPTKEDIRKIRPAKDSVKFEGDLRIPFRRIFNEPPTGFWDFGALSRLTYETQLWPNSWLTNLPRELWPHRTNDIRVLLGLSLKPVASNETLRVGAVLDYDISRNSPLQAFGYGFEFGGQGKWNVGYFTLKLESTLRQLFPIASPEKTRMGLIWLIDGKVEVPIYSGLSLSLLANTTVGTRMSAPLTPGYSVLFGFALSFSDSFKWLF